MTENSLQRETINCCPTDYKTSQTTHISSGCLPARTSPRATVWGRGTAWPDKPALLQRGDPTHVCWGSVPWPSRLPCAEKVRDLLRLQRTFPVRPWEDLKWNTSEEGLLPERGQEGQGLRLPSVARLQPGVQHPPAVLLWAGWGGSACAPLDTPPDYCRVPGSAEPRFCLPWGWSRGVSWELETKAHRQAYRRFLCPDQDVTPKSFLVAIWPPAHGWNAGLPTRSPSLPCAVLLQELQTPHLHAVPDILLVHPLCSALLPPSTKTEPLSESSLSQSVRRVRTLTRSVRHLLFWPWHTLSVISIFHAAEDNFPDNFPRPWLHTWHTSLCITRSGFPEKPLGSSPYTVNTSFLAEKRRCGKRGESHAEDERRVHTSCWPFREMVGTPRAMGRKAGRAGYHCSAEGYATGVLLEQCKAYLSWPQRN